MLEQCPVQIMQVEEEFKMLMDAFKAVKPKTIVEIGSHFGGSLYFWIREAEPGATVVSIDLGTWNPYGRLGPWFEWATKAKVLLFPIIGDSKDRTIAERVEKIAAPIDFLFIDGSHTEVDAQADFDNYWPMVRKGGICALHDIAPDHANMEAYGVWKVWDRIKKSGVRTEEKIVSRGSCGTGIAYK